MMEFLLWAIVPLSVIGHIAAYNLGRVLQRRGKGINENADLAASSLRFIILTISVLIVVVIASYFKSKLW